MADQPLQHPFGDCYVYTIAVDGIVRYIGKGTGYRIGRHMQTAKKLNRQRGVGEHPRALKFHNRLAKAIREGSTVVASKIAVGLSSADALSREVAEIAAIPNGQLWNETRGGDGLDPDSARRLWADPSHRDKMKAIHEDPAFREKQRRNTIRQFADPEQRRQGSERSRALWRDPSFAEKAVAAVRAGVGTEDSRRKSSEAAKRRFADPAERERRGIISKKYASTPEFKARHSRKMKELWNDPAFRAKCIAQWTDPQSRQKRAANLTPEFLAGRGKAIAAGLARRKARTGSIR